MGKTMMPDPENDSLNVLIRSNLSNPVAIGLAESLLDEAEIPFFVMDANIAARQEAGNVMGWWNIRVPAEFENEAREILRSIEDAR